MRPGNVNPDLLLPDNAPVRCDFWARADAPLFMEECETHATCVLEPHVTTAIIRWLSDHPKAIVGLRSLAMPNYNPYLCDTHRQWVKDIVGL